MLHKHYPSKKNICECDLTNAKYLSCNAIDDRWLYLHFEGKSRLCRLIDFDISREIDWYINKKVKYDFSSNYITSFQV